MLRLADRQFDFLELMCRGGCRVPGGGGGFGDQSAQLLEGIGLQPGEMRIHGVVIFKGRF